MQHLGFGLCLVQLAVQPGPGNVDNLAKARSCGGLGPRAVWYLRRDLVQLRADKRAKLLARSIVENRGRVVDLPANQRLSISAHRSPTKHRRPTRSKLDGVHSALAFPLSPPWPRTLGIQLGFVLEREKTQGIRVNRCRPATSTQQIC